MMRILTPKGSLVEILKAEPFAETRVHFNGHEVRLCQIVKDTRQMSGLYLTGDCSGFGMVSQGTIILGNLKQEKSEEIMQKLLTDGYADLSVLEYQPTAEHDKLPVFDEGKTLPYYIDGSMDTIVYAPARADAPLGGNAPFTMGMGMASGNNVFVEDEPKEADDEEV